MPRVTKAEREQRMMMAARLRIAAELVGQVWRDAGCPDSVVVDLRTKEQLLMSQADVIANASTSFRPLGRVGRGAAIGQNPILG